MHRSSGSNKTSDAAPHPIQRRFLAEDLVRLRRADEERRYVASQRQGRIDPNPHQIDAVIFALRRVREGGCIMADEVGLGKTIEAGLVIAQLLAEGMRRVLVIVPKPLVGQWRQELYALFGIEAREGGTAAGDFDGAGVFLAGRELAGGEAGSAALMAADPFDLCVIDEAHEIFAGIYKRFDKHGYYRDDAPEAQMAARVRGVLLDTPVLLLTATPIQNTLTELWGLAQYVEPTGTLLGDLRTFRQLFCDGNDRELIEGQEHELRRRIATICQRTLRRQAQEFLEKPFVGRKTQLFEYSMTPEEKSLYDDVTNYLLRPGLAAFRGNHRRLLIIAFHRQMASSVPALAKSLRGVAARLHRLLTAFDPAELDDAAAALVGDLEDDGDAVGPGDLDVDEGPPPAAGPVAEELALVESFVERAEALPHDGKAESLKQAVRVALGRGAGAGKLVIFTESLTTQKYLRELVRSAGVPDDQITLFRGTNDGPRAAEALARWEAEVAPEIPDYNRPSRDVAVRLALVHEFKTRSRVFVSTEAGAKGLNLQFCDTLINYDLPWNPQRIEQRIGRCHRYGQTHDVTVINFLARDNETQRLTFDILSRKLDLFGTVLDASDSVLHEPRTRTPETLAGALAVDFETRLRRIYERARSVQEIEAELRELRETIGSEGERMDQAQARTRSLIETRFDENVRGVFKSIRDALAPSLAELDRDLDRLITGYLQAAGIAFVRAADDGRVRFEIGPSAALPEGLREGLTVAVGHAGQIGDADPVHLGHPLLRAAVAEAREATARPFRVRLTVPDASPLAGRRGCRGRLVVIKVAYGGFEPVEGLLPVGLIEGEDAALPEDQALGLLELAPEDVAAFEAPVAIDDDQVEAAREEILFLDQCGASAVEQERFDRAIEQLERYMDDRTTVLSRQRGEMQKRLEQAEAERDGVVGAERRGKIEAKLRTLASGLEKLEAEIRRLETRDDANYDKWRDSAHARRYAVPTHETILDVEFELR